MKLENFKTYDELPEEDKNKYKPINEKSDSVEKTAAENSEVAHRIALLKSEAFGELEESIKQNNISVDEIIEKLGDKKLGYDEKDKLQDLLFQNADLQRLKGNPIDNQLKEVLRKAYPSLRYSKILTEKLVKGINPGDVAVIGEVLKDEKIRADWEILHKLTDDEQRLQAFMICKERVQAACSIIDNVKDTNMALKMYAEALGLATQESYSDNSKLESSGKRLANKLFESGATKQLTDLVRSDTFKLSYFKDFMHRFGSEPHIIIDLVKNSQNVNDIRYALKFVTDPKLLTQLEADADNFSKLTNEQIGEVIEYSKSIAQALGADPEIITLSEFKKDEEDKWAGKKVAKNKFVVGIQRGKYVIAWSNMDKYENHRDIFEKVQLASVRSGGYIGMDEKDGKTIIRMVRSSGDYGFYSRELLEHYRDSIVKTLRDVLGEQNQNFELEIKTSSEYE